MPIKDQRETRDSKNKSLLLFRTTTGLVMSKSGCSKDIRPKLRPSGDLLTPLDIASQPTTLKTSRETRSQPMSHLSITRSKFVLSGKSSNPETDGTL
jgi:hypothetical protein